MPRSEESRAGRARTPPSTYKGPGGEEGEAGRMAQGSRGGGGGGEGKGTGGRRGWGGAENRGLLTLSGKWAAATERAG